MNVQAIITKKRDGLAMSPDEIKNWVKGISDGSIPDYQISAWAMAVYFQGMNEAETTELSLAMAYSGDAADLSPIAGIKVDKHSTGGVGDKTTMVVIPLAAAAGVPVAKMSGRGLGHTGGTIDKFEAIPGFKVEQGYNDFLEQVNRVKCAVISQSGNLVPADKKLYAIRDVTATVESIPLIASSIMSKKIAAGAEGIVLDVKVGSGAFMKSREEAAQLARTMIKIGQGVGREVVAILSNMEQPLGNMVGNALEVREAIDTLKGNGPADLEHICIELAAHMLVLGKKAAAFEEAAVIIRDILKSGQGLAKFEEMVTAQGGKIQLSLPDYGLAQTNIREELVSLEEGYVAEVDALKVGRAAMLLGAGREQLGDKIDYSVGIELVKKHGEYVQKGETLALIHANDVKNLKTVHAELYSAYQFRPDPVKNSPLILETIY